MINIKESDRAQRVLMGTLLIILNVLNSFNSKWSLASFASLFLQIELVVTGVVGWCPLYWGLNKYKNINKKEVINESK